MSKTISGLPLAETLTGNELLPVVQDGNTVQSTVQQVADLVGNTATWGDIQGTLSNQTDLQTALDGKYSTSNPAGYITSSALTGYAPLNSPTFTGTVGGITKSMVGLGNVDNTADANKSVNYANTAGSASNSDTVDGYHIQVDGTGTNPNTIYFKTTGGVDPGAAIWGDITGSIVDQTDLYNALVNGTYATGNWNINAASVDGYSVQVDGTGTDPNTIYFKTTGGTISVDWDDVANTPTTVSGYGITDAVTTSGNQTIGGTKTFSSTITGSITGNADTVDGYNVQVDGTGTNPNTIYFKTEGGTISVDWEDVTNTPTTIAGYGITDAYTETESDARFLGISATAVNSDMVDGYNIQVDGTGTNPNTIYFKTEGGTTSVAWGNISGTLSDQTDLQTALNGKVPYTGATGNVNLGEYGLTSGFLQADLTPTNALQVGRMQWNDTDGTMDLRLKGNNVTLQIGQEQVIRVVNKTGADLLEANYQCVKISGAQGQRPKVALAQANNDANSADTIGLVTETIANNQEGFVTDSGMVTNINTTGSLQGETWADGDVLYLSGTVAGRLTNIKPQAPIHTVIVGFVIYAHNNQGKIYVKVDNGYELNELHNVRINGVTDGQVLAYDSTLSVWENINQSAITSGNSDMVDGYNIQVDGTGTNPNTIYFKTAGGSIGVDWDDVSNTPTTVAGYGITDAVTTSGNQTIGGTKTFSSTITGSITGNAGTVTNGVYTSGDQTIGGTKTFSSTITGSITGNAGTVTNGVYTTGTQTITGNKTFTGSVTMGQSGGGEGGEILWLDPVQGTVCTDIPSSGVFRVFQTSGTAKGAYIDLANCAGGVGSLLLHSTNYNSFAPTLTGTGASGSWGISVTGNAGTVTNGVYTTGDQTIAGIKTFSGTSTIVNGNLGIGTVSPINKLTISGSSLASGELGTFAITGNTTAKRLAMGVDSTSTMYGWIQSVESGVGFRNLSLQPLGGNVGIGTSSPDGKLMVVATGAYNGSVASRTAIQLDNTNNTGGFTNSRIQWTWGGVGVGVKGYIEGGTYGSDYLGFGFNTTERMRIDSAGNVGIGNNNPIFKLDVNGNFRIANDGGGGYGGLWTIRNTASGATNPDKSFRINPTGGLEIINNAYNAVPFTFSDDGILYASASVRSSIFYDQDNTAFYVNPNGTSNINALVMNDFIQGRSCASTDVNTANDTGSISIRGSSTTVASMSFHRTGAYAMNMGLGTDNVFRIGGWSASNNCLQMDGSGNLTMLNNVTAYSDARLKTDVVKIENALDKVQQLNGYTYTRTDTGSKQTGVIAQEVMKVLPEVVMGSEDTHYSVAYGNMVGLLIEAIKEQQSQINELKLTIEQLKGN